MNIARTPPSSSASPPLSAALYRALVLGLSGLAILAQVSRVDGLYLHVLQLGAGPGAIAAPPPSYLGVVLFDAMLTLASGAFAMSLAFRRRPQHGVLPAALVLAVWSYLFAYAAVVHWLRPAPGTAAHLLFEGHFLVVELLGLAGLLRWSAVFPRPLGPADLQPPSELPPGFGVLQRARTWLLRPGAPWMAVAGTLVVVLALNALLGRPVEDAPFLPVVELLPFVALTFVVSNLRRAHALGTPEGRWRVEWLAAGFAVLVASIALVVGGNVLLSVTDWRMPGFNWRSLVLHAGVLALVCGLVMGTAYSGPRRPGPWARNALILAGTVLFGLLFASALEALLTGRLAPGLSLPTGLGTVVAAVCAVIAWRRLHEPLDRALERGLGTHDATPSRTPPATV